MIAAVMKRAFGSILVAAWMLVPALAHAAFETKVTDLDGNLRSDLLWRNTATGQVYRIPMNGLAPSAGSMIYTEPDTRWKIVGDGDFNGDGRADLLWRNDVDGRIYVALSAAGGAPGAGAVVHVEPNLAWHIVSTVDFDGDGKSDLLWWNESTGQVYLMAMNGAAIGSQRLLYTEPNTAWRIAGAEGGRLYWRNTSTGAVYRQSFAFPAGTPSGAVIWVEPNPAWKILGLADFNNDGVGDLLWRNDVTGQVYGQVMNANGTIGAGGMIHVEPNLSWRIVALADYDGDGRSDLLWRNFSTGQVYLMRLNGLSIAQQGMVYVEPEQLWRVLGTNDYSDDDRVPPTAASISTAMAAIVGTKVIPASCDGNPRINCPNGVPTPTTITLALSEVAPVMSGPTSGGVTAKLVAVASNVHVSYTQSGVGTLSCFVDVDNRAGAQPSSALSASASFVSQYQGGPLNRLSFGSVSVAIESADYTVKGDITCSLASGFAPLITALLADQVSAQLSVANCGSPGPDLFAKCPP